MRQKNKNKNQFHNKKKHTKSSSSNVKNYIHRNKKNSIYFLNMNKKLDEKKGREKKLTVTYVRKPYAKKVL